MKIKLLMSDRPFLLISSKETGLRIRVRPFYPNIGHQKIQQKAFVFQCFGRFLVTILEAKAATPR